MLIDSHLPQADPFSLVPTFKLLTSVFSGEYKNPTATKSSFSLCFNFLAFLDLGPDITTRILDPHS
jgi:hypothetical protein